MKRNIDLTENRLFSRKRNTHIKRMAIDDALVSGYQDRAIIIEGNGETRAEVRGYIQMDSDYYCDRCGSKMNLIPWDREEGLCHKCSNYYENNIDKCKWRIKEDIENSDVRMV